MNCVDNCGEPPAYIRLRNVGDAAEVWEAPITSELVIGRSPQCRIRLADKSVSREQCRIFLSGAAMVENLSETNITKLNGDPLHTPAAITAGDVLKFGRVSLAVEALSIRGVSGAGGLNKGTVFINI